MHVIQVSGVTNSGKSSSIRQFANEYLARFIHEAAAAKWMGLDLTLAA